MNILHYVESTDSRQGGVPRFVLDASRVMAAEGHPSTILTQDTTETPEAWLTGHDGNSLPAVHRLPRPALLGKLFGPSEMREIRKHLKKADVLHTHCVWNPATLQIAAAARQMGVPYVVSLHGMLDDWCMAQRSLKKRAYMSLGGRHFLEHAARVHCTARAELDQSKKWFPNGAEAIIPYLMDLEPFRQLPGRELAAKRFTFLENGGEPTVLFLSRLHYKKGPELLLQAASRLRTQGIRGQVAFAGTGEPAYVESLKTIASKLGIAGNVHFLGQVIGREKISLYQNADLFVLPTSQENFGLVLIEALACGTPLITTKGVDIWQDVQASGAAEIVDQRPEQLAEAIAKLLSDESLRRDMGAKARPWVFETYGEQTLIGRYEKFYADCAGRGPASTASDSAHFDRALPELAAVA
ncbi:MAG: glycosyltransferase [Phycisphaerae bacterium]|nr:glycosyltransferase [Phycisphaerae bacterium]